MSLRRRVASALQHNFFVLPAVTVVVAAVLALVVPDGGSGLVTAGSTVSSARAVMTTVAAATVTFASISFSVALLMIQQGSAQFSPRVVHHLTRDSFNRRVVAVVLATFAFCLVSLTRIRGRDDISEADTVPQMSVTIAIVAGIVAVLAVVAGLHHTSQQLDVSRILARIVGDTVIALEGASSRNGSADADRIETVTTPGTDRPVEPPPGPCSTIRFDADGWVCDIDRARLISLGPPGATVCLETYPGRFAVRGATLCRIWPPLGADELEDAATNARAAVELGTTRTMADDTLFGIRQLVDIALRALSPGVNDPTTARDAVANLGTLVVAHLRAGFPRARFTEPDDRHDRDDPQDDTGNGDPGDESAADDGADAPVRTLLLPLAPTVSDMAELAVAEIRRAGAHDPAVLGTLLGMIGTALDAAPGPRSHGELQPLLDQADTIVALIDSETWSDDERRRLEEQHRRLRERAHPRASDLTP